MAEDKNSFVLYADYISTFEELDDKEAGILIKHLFRYVNDKNPEAPDRLTKLIFEPIKQQLKRDLEKWDKTKDRFSKAGKASAEARLLKKQQLYVIRCFNGDEQFIKIGVTDESVSRRFSGGENSNNTMPYNYELLCQFEYKKGEITPSELEAKLKMSFKDHSYIPNLKFAGYTECFDVNCTTLIISTINSSCIDKTCSTTFNNVEINKSCSTKSTVSVNVNDTVNVIVNDTVTVNEIQEKEDFAFNEKKENLINLLIEVFGFSEHKFSQQKSMVYAFVNSQLKSIEDISHFAEQYKNYDEYKKLSGEQRHNSTGYFGTQAMQFQNSAWNSENWGLKLEQYKANNKSTTKFEKLKDAFNTPNPYRQNEQ